MLPINHESPDATLCGDKEQTDHGPSVNFLVCQLETLTKFQCVESVNGNCNCFLLPKTWTHTTTLKTRKTGKNKNKGNKGRGEGGDEGGLRLYRLQNMFVAD